MTKEEILDKYSVGIAAGQYTIDCGKAEVAMDEYAKQQCIEILNFMKRQGIHWNVNNASTPAEKIYEEFKTTNP